VTFRAKANKYRPSKQWPEFQLQCLVAEYLRRQYPNVKFLSDVRASLKLTIPQQVRAKKIQADGFACPDLMIFAVRGTYAGMFLELKAESPYRKDGCLRVDAHLARQMDAIEHLRGEGYHADFYWDFDTTQAAIDRYLALQII